MGSSSVLRLLAGGGEKVPVVLVVEDEDAPRTLLRDVLEMEGYEVEEAPDGVVALQAMDRRMPDLVLLDLRMPRMDGWRVLDEMRARGWRTRTRVIIVSAFVGLGEQVGEGRLDGAMGRVDKPFSPEVLLKAVEEALQEDPADLASRRERVQDLLRIIRLLETP